MDAPNASDTIVIDPAEFLRRKIASEGLTPASLAHKIKCNTQTIYNITGKEARRISANLAIKFSKHIGESVDFWLQNPIRMSSDHEWAAIANGVNITIFKISSNIVQNNFGEAWQELARLTLSLSILEAITAKQGLLREFLGTGIEVNDPALRRLTDNFVVEVIQHFKLAAE